MDRIALLRAVPSISILIDDNGINPVAGLNYSLYCEVSGVNSNASAGVHVSYEWKKDDTPLSETGQLLSFSPLRLAIRCWRVQLHCQHI